MEETPQNTPNPQAKPQPPQMPSEPVTQPKENYTFGMLCHLLGLAALIGIPFGNILGPLIVWLVKKDEDPFVDRCGKESLNFQISATLAGAVLALSSFMLAVPLAFIPFLPMLILPMIALAMLALMILVIVYTIIAAIKTSEGTFYRYPYTFRFIQ